MKAAILSTQMREGCIAEGKSLIFETVYSVEFAEPQLLFRVIDGVITKEYSSNILWTKPMLDFIKS